MPADMARAVPANRRRQPNAGSMVGQTLSQHWANVFCLQKLMYSPQRVEITHELPRRSTQS